MPLYQQGGLPSSKGTLQGLPDIVSGFLQAKQQAEESKADTRYRRALAGYYEQGGRAASESPYLIPMKFRREDGTTYSVIVDKRTGQKVADLSEYGEPYSPLSDFETMLQTMGGRTVQGTLQGTPQAVTPKPSTLAPAPQVKVPSPAPAQKDGVPLISTDEEYDALPSKTEFIDAQTGIRYRKP